MSERVLIHSTHGLGDLVQLTCVFRHLKKHYPSWELYLQCLRGKHSVGKGHCVRTWHEQEPSPDHAWFQRYFRLKWWENYNSYSDCPNSKVTNCLREVFGITPEEELLKYQLFWDEEDLRITREYLESCGCVKKPNGRYNAVVMHYQGNTSPHKKNLSHETASAVCEHAIAAGYVPIILDWDRRSPLPDGHRIYNPSVAPNDIWGGFGSGDACRIAALVEQSSLFIGIDSGPQKAAGATTTPCLGVWHGHSPVQFFDLCDNFTHLVPEKWWEVPPCQNKGVAAYFESHYKFKTYSDLTADLVRAMAETLDSGILETNRLHGFHYIEGKSDQDWVVIEDIYLNDAYRTCLIPRRKGPEIVVDVGAHIGCFSRLWHERNPQARIISVEANPDCAAVLRKNVGDFAEVIEAACVGNVPEPLYMLNAVRGTAEVGSTGGSRIVTRDVWEAETDPQYRKDPETVKTISLRQIMEEYHLPRIDILKLDCEGSEFSILEDVPLDKIGFILGEYHGWERFQNLLRERFQNFDFGHMSQNGDMGNFHLRNRRPV